MTQCLQLPDMSITLKTCAVAPASWLELTCVKRLIAHCLTCFGAQPNIREMLTLYQQKPRYPFSQIYICYLHLIQAPTHICACPQIRWLEIASFSRVCRGTTSFYNYLWAHQHMSLPPRSTTLPLNSPPLVDCLDLSILSAIPYWR